MKTGASWRCWTCTQNGTDQPQQKRSASGFLRLSSARGRDKNAKKRPRSKRPRDARKTYLCGCWSAYCRSDIGLQPRSACRRRSWSALRRKPCRCGCSNSSLSCKRGPADAGGVGVVNWPRRHRLRPARSRKKGRFARMWRVWLRIPQPNRAGGTGSARLAAVARHYGHMRRGGGDGGPANRGARRQLGTQDPGNLLCIVGGLRHFKSLYLALYLAVSVKNPDTGCIYCICATQLCICQLG